MRDFNMEFEGASYSGQWSDDGVILLVRCEYGENTTHLSGVILDGRPEGGPPPPMVRTLFREILEGAKLRGVL